MLFFNPEDGESMFLQNVGTYLRVHKTWQPRRKTLSPPLEFRISQYTITKIKFIFENAKWESKYTQFNKPVLRCCMCEIRLEANATNTFICNATNTADFYVNTLSANFKHVSLWLFQWKITFTSTKRIKTCFFHTATPICLQQSRPCLDLLQMFLLC
jgi:hypothetical protein